MNELRVLICDDSILIRKKLKNLLETCEVEIVEEAVDGQDAIDKLEIFNPDVIFLDIVMPNKDGIETLIEIKQKCSKVKVIMASSVGTQTNLKKALENGAYDFIQKPVTLESIKSILEKLVKEGYENV